MGELENSYDQKCKIFRVLFIYKFEYKDLFCSSVPLIGEWDNLGRLTIVFSLMCLNIVLNAGLKKFFKYKN